MLTFMMLHNLNISASEDEKYEKVIALASGSLAEEDLASWLQAVAVPLSGS